MGDRVGFCKKISEIEFASAPLEVEMSHGDAVLDPMIPARNGFGSALLAASVSYVPGDSVIVVYNCGWLWETEVF